MKEKLQATQKSPSCAKIALFRSLFRGCEDLYPRRFESEKWENRATHPHAATSGSEEFAKSQKSNALNADTTSFYP